MTIIKAGDVSDVIDPLHLTLIADVPVGIVAAAPGAPPFTAIEFVIGAVVPVSLPHNYGIGVTWTRDNLAGLTSLNAWATDGVGPPTSQPRNINGDPSFPYNFLPLDDGNPAPNADTFNGNPVYWLEAVSGPGPVPDFDYFVRLGTYTFGDEPMTGSVKVYEWWGDPPPPPPPPPPPEVCTVTAPFPYRDLSVGDPKAGVIPSKRRVIGGDGPPVVIAQDPKVRAAIQRIIGTN